MKYFFVLLLAASAFAGETVNTLTVKDKTYHNVRWGVVNKGKVTILHNQGAATVAIADLPPEYWQKFGYKPPAEPVEEAVGNWNPVVSKSPVLSPLEVRNSNNNQKIEEFTGYYRQVTLEVEGSPSRKVWALELAKCKEKGVPRTMAQRPGLWKPTGDYLILPNYRPKDPDVSQVIFLNGIEVDRIANFRAIQVMEKKK